MLSTADCLRSRQCPKGQVSYATCSIQVVGWWPSPHPYHSHSRTRRCKLNSYAAWLVRVERRQHCDGQCVTQVSDLALSPSNMQYIDFRQISTTNLPFLTQPGIAKATNDRSYASLWSSLGISTAYIHATMYLIAENFHHGPSNLVSFSWNS